jgi:sugar phosphate isomerase/epimerase
MNNPMGNLLKEIQWIGENGFDFVDLTLEPPGAYATSIEYDLVRDLLERYNLDAIGHTAYYLPLASPFSSFGELALKELCKCFEAFQTLDISKVNIHADEYSAGIFSKDRTLIRNIRAMKSAVEEAKRYNVKLMIENTMRVLGTADDLEMLFNKVPDMGFHLDVGHANLNTETNKTEELLKRFHKRLEHVHFSDNKGGTADLHLPLGAGLIPWNKMVAALKRYGYDGTITIEVFSRDRRYLLASRDKLLELWDCDE